MGSLYKEGKGVVRDLKEAVKWYRFAAEQGNSSAQLQLAISYMNGDGIPQDYVQAHKWVNLAAADGEDGAAEGRELVSKLMTTEQIAEAQLLARKWKPRKWEELKDDQ